MLLPHSHSRAEKRPVLRLLFSIQIMKATLPPLFLTAAVSVACLTGTQAQSTINPTKAYAYAANAGWLNFRPSPADGIKVSEYSLSGKVYGANIGWINLGNGSANQYTNTSAADFGVNHDGTGKLFGYAWGANIGWIKFGEVSDSGPQRARFNLATGFFDGYAWSANPGWINLGGSNLKTDSIQRPDADGDGLGDAWENAYTGGLTILSGAADNDGDGRTNLQEYLADTNPLAKDAAPALNILSGTRDMAGHTTSHLQFDGRATRTYVLQASASLTAGTWSNLESIPGVGGYSDRYPVSSDPRRFYRLAVTLPTIP
jgi:hypothetical protein